MSFFDTEPATDSEEATRKERPGGLIAGLVVLGVVGLVGAGWALAYDNAADNVPRGTTVVGVDIGGRPPAEAARVLEDALSEQATGPIVLQIGERSIEVDPVEAGLSVDHLATVEGAGGERTWDPRRLWDYYTGGEEQEPVVEVDDEAMDRVVEQTAAEVGRPARDGRVRLRPGGPRVVQARNGTTLEADPTRAAIEAAYLAPQPAVEVSLAPVVPEIDQADVQSALDSFANPAYSAPVTLRLDGEEVRLRPAELAPAMSMVAADGVLVPEIDDEVVQGLLAQQAPDAGSRPVDASIEVADGEPRVVPAERGVTFAAQDVSAALMKALVRPESRRSVAVKTTVERPDLTTRQARRLGVEELVSDFSTFYPDADYRNVNLGRAAEIIDGTLLEPGEVFSLNDIVGERTRANGFTEGFIISDGILVEDLGGGVSQMATTLFNAMYFAGLEDVEHKPHSFYIDRYPVGREATVAFGAIDLRFRNDTDHGVLVKAAVTPSSGGSQGEVNVRMYSTQEWDVESRTGERYRFTEPTTRTLDTPDCYAYTGSGGFTINVFRDFKRPGQDRVVRTERFNTVYTPSDGVQCVPPGSDGAE